MSSLDRKRREINLMRSWIAEEPLADLGPQYNVLTEKIRLIRHCAARQLLAHPVMLTNIKQEKLTILGEEFHTHYSRQGGQFTTPEQLRIFYPQIAEDLRSVGGSGHFLKSGQSANFVALLFLQSLAEEISFAVPERVIYFETHAIMHYLQKNAHRPLSRFKGLFIDSGVMDLSGITQAHVEAHDLVIFDTTCFSSADPEFLRILRLLRQSQRTVLLTRSHLKLDSFGVEYGALGSLFVLNGSAFPADLPSEIGSLDVQLDQLISKLASIAGVHAQPHEIYPFMNDPAFCQLNGERVDALKQNMRRVEDALGLAIAHHQLPLRVERYGHQLYCKVRLGHSFGDKLPGAIAKVRSAFGEAVFLSDSFGYDYLGICEFSNSQGDSFLRVTAFDSDISDETLRILFMMVFELYTTRTP